MPLRNAGAEAGEFENLTAIFDDETRPSTPRGDRGVRRRVGGPRALAQRRDRGARAAAAAPRAGYAQPLRSEDRAPRPLSPSRACAGELAPVAAVQGEFFANQATTFAALGRDPEALREAIEEAPPTLDASIRSLRVQTPFLARFADLSRRLQPGAEAPRVSLPSINDALRSHAATSPRPRAGRGPRAAFARARGPGREPGHAAGTARPARGAAGHAAADRVRGAVSDGLQLLRLLLGAERTHLPQTVRGPDGRALGTAQRVLSQLGSRTDNGYGTSASSRPVDVPPGDRPSGAQAGPALHSQRPSPAVDERGRADCQVGQWGYPGPAGDRRPLGAAPVGRRTHRRRPRHPRPGRRHLGPPEGSASTARGCAVAMAISAEKRASPSPAASRRSGPPVRAGPDRGAGVLRLHEGEPVCEPFELKAVVADAGNLQARSPVRIAGVEVGEVTKVEPIRESSSGARVTMELTDEALPLREDAELKIRPRIFLEGNYFVDLEPGSPSHPSSRTVTRSRAHRPRRPSRPPRCSPSCSPTSGTTSARSSSSSAPRGSAGGGAEGFNRAVPLPACPPALGAGQRCAARRNPIATSSGCCAASSEPSTPSPTTLEPLSS